MRNLAFAFLLAVGLGGDFGDASAEILSIGENSMIISVEVEVTVSADSVVAHMASPGNETLTLPLLDRGDGIFGIQTEVGIIDYQVSFELLGPTSSVSEPVSLSAMGADFGDSPATATTTTVDEGFSSNTRRWGWLALALAAASLAVLAVWVVVGRDHDDEEADPTQSAESGEIGESDAPTIDDQAGDTG